MRKTLFWIIAGVIAGAVCLSFSKGNYPFNDDWVYAWSVRHLVDTGSVRLSDWAVTSIVFQILWARLFCFAGFSFTMS